MFLPNLKKISVIGGDERCCVCANMFSESGYECAVFGLENSEKLCRATKCASLSDALCECDALVLPVPVMRDSTSINAPLSDKKILISDIVPLIEKNTLIFAGNPGKCFYSALSAEGLENTVINYADSNVFSIMSAIPTAEGAIAEALGITGKTIFGSNILVCGYGKIGKYLSNLLRAMGANVYAGARKDEDLEWINANSLHPLRTNALAQCDIAFDLIFNTVPSMIFDEELLSALRGLPVIVELASKPYGVDFEAAHELGIKTVVAGGLPGKISPVTAGEIMYKCICRKLCSRESAV